MFSQETDANNSKMKTTKLYRLSNNYTVYKHTSPSGKVYIGITHQTANRRWRDGSGYVKCVKFKQAINKYGWDNLKHEIIAKHLTMDAAVNMERNLIKHYMALGLSYNIALGGECGPITEEHRRHLSESKKGKPMHPKTRAALLKAITGRVISDETRYKMSNSQLGKQHSIESRLKMSKKHSKTVIQIDKNTNTVIAKYSSAKEAARAINFYAANITRCCRDNTKSCKGFKWKYAD